MRQKITEKAFQQLVIKAAKVCGFIVYHTYDSRRSAAGFPDLVLVHAKRKQIYFLELKTETGKVRPEQQMWINALVAAGQNAAIVRPSEWDSWLWPALRGGRD